MATTNTQRKQTVGLVFIHGVGLGSWIWRDVTPELTMPFLATDFPERTGAPESRKSLSFDNYAEHVRQQVDGWGTKKVVVVGHSLGGVVALKIADAIGDRLAGFIAIGAAIPRNGGSFLSCLPFPKNIVMGVIMRAAGTRPPESAIRKSLCNDLPADQTQEVIKCFAPESIGLYTGNAGAGIPDVPKLYVKLTKDQNFGTAMQDGMAANLNTKQVVELDTGHMPMLSKPKELAGILNDFVEEL